ncbi:MAG: hypothetical protein EOO89_23425 [Pedobacter sp.]|nr:MAG: hypothetical protein EOO89_23425 [Pedobacter sp.]
MDKVINGGKQASGLNFNMDGSRLAAISLNQMGNNKTLYPFIHLYQQSKNERVLLEYLTTACCPVYWETTLISLKQNADAVDACGACCVIVACAGIYLIKIYGCCLYPKACNANQHQQ